MESVYLERYYKRQKKRAERWMAFAATFSRIATPLGYFFEALCTTPFNRVAALLRHQEYLLKIGAIDRPLNGVIDAFRFIIQRDGTWGLWKGSFVAGCGILIDEACTVLVQTLGAQICYSLIGGIGGVLSFVTLQVLERAFVSTVTSNLELQQILGYKNYSLSSTNSALRESWTGWKLNLPIAIFDMVGNVAIGMPLISFVQTWLDQSGLLKSLASWKSFLLGIFFDQFLDAVAYPLRYVREAQQLHAIQHSGISAAVPSQFHMLQHLTQGSYDIRRVYCGISANFINSVIGYVARVFWSFGTDVFLMQLYNFLYGKKK